MDALQRADEHIVPFFPWHVIIPGQGAVIFIGTGGPEGRYVFQHITIIAGVIQLDSGGNIVALIKIMVKHVPPDTVPEKIQILIHVGGLEIRRPAVRHAGAFQQAAEHSKIQHV